MGLAANAQNPIFIVYGLAHGEGSDELQDFLSGEGEAILVHILPHLLIRQWQYARMNFAAELMRQRLRKNIAIFNKTDGELRCFSSQKLSNRLQRMATSEAEATELSGNLHKAIKTIEIHRNNLTRRLKYWHKNYSQWHLVWQYEDETPILERFDSDIRDLKNHLEYIKGDLTYSPYAEKL